MHYKNQYLISTIVDILGNLVGFITTTKGEEIIIRTYFSSDKVSYKELIKNSIPFNMFNNDFDLIEIIDLGETKSVIEIYNKVSKLESSFTFRFTI